MSEKPEPMAFRLLTWDELEALAANLRSDQPVVLLPPGITKGDRKQLDRIERKLDALLEALAEDGVEEQDHPAITLDGDAVPADRDQTQSLG